MAIQCVLLLALTAGALAGPLGSWDDIPRQCATYCPASSKFSYTPGKIYEYAYESNTRTTIPTSTEEHASLQMRATVQVAALSPCEMAVKLADVQLAASDATGRARMQPVEGSAAFRRALERTPLRFAFIDGVIEAVCPEADEPAWVLNIKRGILSALQNSMHTLDQGVVTREIDIAGDCPVEYTVVAAGYIKKVKNILACVDRHGANAVFQGTPYDIKSDIQSAPLMKTTHECEQRVNAAGVMAESACTEMHIFRPFSRQHSGALTEINYKLTLLNVQAGRMAVGRLGRRAAMLFQHVSSGAMEENMQAAMQTMRAMCAQADIRPNTPALFTRLIEEMRSLDARNMAQFYRRVAAGGACAQAEKIVRDAIPMINTEASVALIAEMVLAGKVNGMEADIWLTSMAFIGKPTAAMLASLTPLLEMPAHESQKTMVAVTSLVNNFCRVNADCATMPQLQAIVRILAEMLKYNCKPADQQDHDRIMLALKALSNAGHAEKFAATLNRCVRNEDAGLDVRVAAIEAFRRLSCAADRSQLMALLRNMHADAELRINAYLAIMKCPDAETIAAITNILQNEEINQVGSFMWTHLSNLKETSALLKQAIRALLDAEHLKRAFDLDKRKFSRNLEWSFFNPRANAGAAVESNVIWATDSFVPRSAMVNLDVDVFGETMNLMQMGGRVEGLESLIEGLLGHAGNDVAARRKRSAITNNQIDALSRRFNARSVDGMKASYEMKLFGNLMRYGVFNSADLKAGMPNYLDLLIWLANEKSVNLHKNIKFLDASFAIPTAIGMPLRMRVEGTASVQVQITGKADLRQIMTKPHSIDINGAIKPSAAVDVIGTMSMDAFVSQTGLKLATTLHTSTEAAGLIQLQQGKLFNIDINMPRDNIEILSIESKFHMLQHGVERVPAMLATADQLEWSRCAGSTVLGLQACAEVAIPRPFANAAAAWFPLSGPAYAKVYINKVDTHTGYHVEARYAQKKGRRDNKMVIMSDTAKISLDMPGARADRELTAELVVNRADPEMTLRLRSPWKKLDLAGAFVNTAAMRRVQMSAMMDQAANYVVVAQVAVAQRDAGVQYTPHVEITIPGARPITLDGSVFMSGQKQIQIDLNLQNALADPITVKGELQRIEEKKYKKVSGKVEVASALLRGTCNGYVTLSDKAALTFSSRLKTEYTYRSGPKQQIQLDNKMKYRSTKNLKQYSVDSSMTTNIWPRYDAGQLKVDCTVGAASIDTNIQAGFGAVRKVIISETIAYNFSPKAATKTLTAQAKFDLPIKNWHYEANVKHEQAANKMDSNASFKYGQQEAVAAVMLARESMKPMKTRATASLRYPGREMSIVQTIMEQPDQTYHQMLTVNLDKYQKATVAAVLAMGAPHKLTVDIQLPAVSAIHAEGSINPRMANFAAAAKLTYAAKQLLAVAANLKTKGAPAAVAFNAAGDLAVIYYTRQLKLDGSVNRDGNAYAGNLKTQLDAAAVTIAATMTASAQRPKIAVNIQLPGNDFVDIKANGIYPAQGAYSGRGGTSGAMAMTSSYAGFEAAGTSFKYNMVDPGAVKATVELYWAKGKKVKADLTTKIASDLADIECTLVVRTPFQGFRSNQLDVTYNLAGRNHAATARAQWDRKAIELALNGMANMARGQMKMDAALTTPWRNYEDMKANANYNYNGPTVNAAVAASWARNQAIRADLALNMPGGAWNGDARLTVATPFEGYGNTEVTARHNLDGAKSESTAEVTLANGKRLRVVATVNIPGGLANMAANVNIITPFANMRQIAAQFSHNHNLRAINTEMEASWGAGKKISAVLVVAMPRGMSDIDATITVRTPFANHELSSLNANYKLAAQALNAGIGGQLYGKEVALTLVGGADQLAQMVNAEARLKTSFRAARDISVILKRAVTGNQHAIDAEVNWARGRRIAIALNMNHVLDGFALANSGQIMADTPFNGYRNVLLKWDHNNAANMLKTSTELHMDGVRKIIASIDASHVLSARRRDLAATVSLAAPALGLDAIAFSATHQHNLRNLRNIKSQAALKWGADKAITYAHELDLVPFESIVGNAKLTSPYTADIVANMNSRKHRDGVNIHKQLAWGNDKMALDGNVDMKADGIASHMRFTSPFDAARRLVFNMDKRAEGAQTALHADFEYARGTKIDMNVRWAISTFEMLLGFDLVSPIPYLRSCGAGVELSGHARNFKLAGHVAHAAMGGRIVMEVDADTENVADINTRVFVSVPFDAAIKYVEATVTHKQRGAYRFISGASVKCTGFEASVNHDLTARSAQSFTTKSTIMYGRGQKIVIAAAYQQGDAVNAKFELRTPFAAAKELVLTINHDGPSNNFKTNVELSYAPNKKIAAGAEFALNNYNLRAMARLTTLCPYARNIALTVNHNGPITNFNNGVVLQLNDKRFSSQNEFMMDRGVVKIVMHLETPYTGFDAMHLEVDHSGTMANLRTAVTLTYPTGTIAANCQLAIAGNEARGTIALATPYAAAKQIKIEFNGNVKHWGEFSNAAAVTINGKQFSGTTDFKWVGNTLHAKVVANVPHQYIMKLNHEGPMTNFKTKGSVALPVPGYERFAVDVDHRGTTDNFRSSAKLDSAMLDQPSVVTVNHRGSLMDFESGVDAEHGGRSMGVTTKYRRAGDSTSGSVRMRTPYAGLESIGASASHNGDSKKFDANVAVDTPMEGYKQFSAELKHENTRRGFKTSVALRTPFDKYERLGAELSHASNRNGFTTNGAVTTSIPAYRRFDFNVNHNGEVGNFETNAVVNLPKLPAVTANVVHRGHLRDFASGASVAYGAKEVQADVVFKQVGENIDASITLKTTFAQLNDLALTASHSNAANGKKGSLEAIVNQMKVAAMAYTYMAGQRVQATMTLHRPVTVEAMVAVDYATAEKQVEATFSLIESRRTRKVRVEAGFKNEAGRASIDREARFMIELPTREVAMLVAYTQAAGQFTHKAQLQWDRAADAKLAYDVALTQAVRRGENIVDGRVNVRSAILNAAVTLANRIAPGRMYTTQVDVTTAQTLTVKNVLIVTHPTYKNTVTLKHPMFSRDAVVALDCLCNAKAVEVKAAIDYERESIAMSARVADESRYANTWYAVQMRLAHPNSKLDVQLDAEAINNQQMTSANVAVKYMMSRDARFRKAAIRAAIDKIQNRVELKVETPAGDIMMNVRKTAATGGIHSVAMNAKAGAMAIDGVAALDLAKRSIDVTMNYPGANTMTMYAKYINNANVKMEVYRQEGGQRISDARITIGADGKNRLDGRTYMRPGIMRDLKALVGRIDIVAPMAAVYRQFVHAARQDMTMKGRMMARAADPFIAAARLVAADVNMRAAMLNRALERAIRNNDFYMADTLKACAQYIQVIKQTADAAMVTMATQYVAAMRNIQAAAAQANQAMAAGMVAMRATGAQAMALASQLYDQVAAFAQTYKPYMDAAGQQVAQLVRICLDKVAAFVGTIQMHPKLKAAVGWVLSLDPMDAIRPIMRGYSAVHDISMTVVDVYGKLLDQAFNVIQEFMRRPEVQEVIMWVEDLIAKTQWAADYFEIKDNAMAYATKMSATGLEMVQARLADLLGIAQSGITLWNPDIGDFGYSLTLPFRMVDLQSMPQLTIDVAKHVAELKNLARSYIPLAPPGDDWTMADIYYMYKPSADVINWVPPFAAHASIAGDQHLMTFDKRFFEFAGECSYLLARDFINGQFTVVVNYARARDHVVRKSITVMGGGAQFEVMPDGRVNMNGQLVELPVKAGNMAIRRSGNLVIVENSNGMTVMCDLLHNRCTVQVSGWYYGKTAGLLGTYDNEPYTDMLTADNAIAADAAQLADGWTVGQRCQVVNRARQVDAAPDNRRYRLCAEYFAAAVSPFRPCRMLVDPKPFFTMCLNDMKINVNRIETSEDVCDVASMYVNECRRQGVPLTLPAFCSKCAKPDGDFMPGEEITLRGKRVPAAADVIIVMQHAACNKRVHMKLKDTIDDLEKALRARGLKDVKYGIVGYGGAGVYDRVHSHTIDGELMNTQDKVLLGLDKWTMDAGANVDSMQAVRFAADYPFRTGASKNIVLLPCDACLENAVTYAEMQRLLLAKDVRLHVLMQHDIRLSGRKSAKQAFIFGADRDAIFNPKSIRNLDGDKVLRKQAMMPKDLCVALSEETDGSFFNTLKWLGGKRKLQKKFVDVMVRVIAKKAVPTACQICECVPDITGAGMAVCRNCNRPAPIYKRIPDFAGVNFTGKLQTYRQGGKRNNKKRGKKQRRASDA